MIEPEAARGRREVVAACPYGAVFWNDERSLAQKCTFCAHLLDDGWTQPRCAQACPTGALRAINATPAEWASLCQREALRPLYPELQTRPRVGYANLDRFLCLRLGGGVALVRDGVEECAAGAAIRLLRGGTEVAVGTADAFGDFVFDGLAGEAVEYAVEVRLSGCLPGTAKASVRGGGSFDLIRLEVAR